MAGGDRETRADRARVAAGGSLAGAAALVLALAVSGAAPLLAVALAAAGGFGIALAICEVRVGAEEAALEEALEAARARTEEAVERDARRRAEAEPLASTAAAVAHDLSTPIATIKCNVEWLREALESGRLPGEQGELLEVLHDTSAAADQLNAEVGVLRKAGRGGNGRMPHR